WAAERNQREGRDLDRPASRFRLGSVLAALLGTSLAIAALLCLLQVGGRKDIARDYPRIARLADGTPVLLAPETPSPRMDEHHLPALRLLRRVRRPRRRDPAGRARSVHPPPRQGTERRALLDARPAHRRLLDECRSDGRSAGWRRLALPVRGRRERLRTGAASR